VECDRRATRDRLGEHAMLLCACVVRQVHPIASTTGIDVRARSFDARWAPLEDLDDLAATGPLRRIEAHTRELVGCATANEHSASLAAIFMVRDGLAARRHRLRA
jgi:hypothetical protein